jgi:tetratricopeptide (TPR) repeat protein
MSQTDPHSTAAPPESPTDDGTTDTRAAGAQSPMDARLRGMPARAMRLMRSVRAAIERRQGLEAEQLLARAEPLAGEHPEFLRLAGVTLLLRQRPADAVAVLRRAFEREPTDPLIMINLGSALREAGQHEAAVNLLRNACDTAPDLAPAWYNLGRALGTNSQNLDAIDAYRRAIEIDPRYVKARIGLANSLKISGRTKDAAAEYRAVIAERPRSLDAWAGLSNMKTVKLDEAEVAQLEQIFSDPSINEDNRVTIGFALAKALEDRGQYTEAFGVLCSANAIKRRKMQWDSKGFAQYVGAIARAFDSAPATAASPDQGREVIFVVSLPRSGSTLAEQILASHPRIEGANELGDLNAVIEEESVRRQTPFPAWVPQASPADWKRLGQRYLERTARWRESRPLFTDKALSNWRYVGAALAMLPGARFVNCRRDPVETCLSCYRQLFSHGQAFTYDIGDLTAYWREYDRMMRFWSARYPHRIFDQVYEELLADPEGQTRRLLDFCGVEFDESCLRFHETARNVRTMSAAQVREPLRRDTARAHLYGDLLMPIRLALGATPPGR